MERLATTGGIPPRFLSQMSGRLIDRLIDRRLVEDQLAETDIEVTDAEIDKEIESVKAEIAKMAKAKGQDDVSLETVLKEKGISQKELKDSLRQSIALRKYLTEKRDVSLPSDEEVRSFYENNAEKFTRPEQVHAHHILIRVKKGEGEKAWNKAKKKITSIRKKITAGEITFAEAAKESSEGPSGERGGDMGFISRDRLDEDFSQAAFSLETDTLSEPVKTDFGWHLIKVTERKSSKQVPFEEVEDRLRRKLEEQAIKKGRDKMLSDLRDQAKIEKHPDNIE
jgi:parvulin-like peptidyl-prolyl isomerase